MKILQVTNIVSHHQLPLARELYKLVGEKNFRFAAMQGVDLSRTENGWKSDYSESWILRPSECMEDREEFERFWDEADVVLCGERLIEKMQERVSQKKLVFYMSERWWKPPIGAFRLLHPAFLIKSLKFRALSKNEYFHFLPTGPFSAKDLASFTSMKGRTWSWGYFTDMPNFQRHSVQARQDDEPLKVLWVGRMLPWKRVDLLIRAVAGINEAGKRLHLTLIGDGPERAALEKLAARRLNVKDYTIEGFISASQVPQVMAEHDIYVFPSNSYEGWGAVVNEAMSVGCIMIASDKTGAGKSIIDHGRNGLLFKSGDINDLKNCLNHLLNDGGARVKISEQAVRDLSSLWSPECAAHRFLNVCKSLLNNTSNCQYSKGPMKNV